MIARIQANNVKVISQLTSIIPGLAFSCMVVALCFFGAIQCGISCAYLDAAPVFSTIMNTIGNMMGAIAGLIVPLIVSVFTNTFDDKEGWRMTFFFTASLSIIALILWKIFVTSELVPELNTPLRISAVHNDDYKKMSRKSINS